jgi:hypothetical protein
MSMGSMEHYDALKKCAKVDDPQWWAKFRPAVGALNEWLTKYAGIEGLAHVDNFLDGVTIAADHLAENHFK